MAKNKYTVDYHLIAVVYFADDVPSGSDLATLWSTMDVFPNLPVEISAFRRGVMKSLVPKKSVLGSPIISEILASNSDNLVSIGASSVKRDANNAISDSDFNFIFDRDGVWDGEPAPPIFEISLSRQIIEHMGSIAVIEFINKIFEYFDKYSPMCGFVDISCPSDSFAGMVYGSIFLSNAHLARWIEHIGWMNSGARKGDRVRGLYWGNYLGTKIINRLGGHQDFQEVFAKNAHNYDGTSNAFCWKMTNGLFVSLSLDPFDCRPNQTFGINPTVEMNIKWLISELGTKGVLNYW